MVSRPIIKRLIFQYLQRMLIQKTSLLLRRLVLAMQLKKLTILLANYSFSKSKRQIYSGFPNLVSHADLAKPHDIHKIPILENNKFNIVLLIKQVEEKQSEVNSDKKRKRSALTELATLKDQQTPNTSRLVWFTLLDSTGQPYKGSGATASVLINPSCVIDQFRDAVKVKNSIKLASLDASDLIVYKNHSSFRDKEVPLEEDSLINDLGGSKKDGIIVVVPGQPIQSSNQPQVIGSKPIHKRRQRWIQFEKVLEELQKKDSTITWGNLLSKLTPPEYSSIAQKFNTILNTKNYVQPRRYLDDAQFAYLEKHLSYSTLLLENATFLHLLITHICTILGDVIIGGSQFSLGFGRNHFDCIFFPQNPKTPFI